MQDTLLLLGPRFREEDNVGGRPLRIGQLT